MNLPVKKMMLFTLSACPLGRSMNNVLREVQICQDELSYEVVHVDVHPDLANHYRIKTNPTTLLVDASNQELYRFEGFKETEETLRIIGQVNNKSLRSSDDLPENQEITETYVIYLYQNGMAVPVETFYVNKTSIKAPRITAIGQLLNTRIDKYDNPFPPSSALEGVHFEQGIGEVTILVHPSEAELDQEKMKIVLEHTLAPYGIKSVNIKWIVSGDSQS
ncbi:hypothetical protein CA600_05255 [Paenibacillus sp. VTT E-133280]|jgi:hypothetical protein|uniref:Uncharacterized protein n=3 Tax=Paenibacillaceae TaxID=186822 RepID=A0A7Z2VST7_9BACL|nr:MULTISPECIES: hypothetical protein [Paenibacillaceae]KKC47795.1 hypothetical protein VE23_12845 [Paenibacillus sp. D9]MCK8487459.1 hypothetical protein [Paenibacillus mellifer]MCT1400906.1 hypothetical protein [Paenibacillus sp. p3-SID867]MEC0259856.1 hypothetical protein [Paenibacillus lautus]OZQ68831.1 hypothetical protein CA600_05255 [Paenibacillus sp. VTT E-133280]